MKRSLFWITSGAILLLLCACTASAADEAGDEQPEGDGELGLVLTSMPPIPAGPLCKDEQPAFLMDLSVLQPVALVEPAARTPLRDPVFGSCMVRVTDRAADPADGDPSSGLKNEYSRVQSFNADGSLMLVRGVDGRWYVYSTASLLPLGQVMLDADPRWSATDPFVIHFLSETRLMAYDLHSGTTTTIHDFAAEVPDAVMVWTRYEGSPSMDGYTWGLMAENDDWLNSAYLIYDLRTDTVTALRDLRAMPDDEREVDSVTISPLGNYFLVQMDKYCEPGVLGTDEQPCGLMVYDRDLRNGRGLLRVVGHSDTALDASGKEVFVYQDIDTDQLSMLDLASGKITPLLPLDFSHTGFGLHISGRSFDLPGWVVISTHDGDPVAYTWMDDSVFAVELIPGGRVIRLAHTRSLVDEKMEHDYWAEPMASVNLDLTRILFTSNWGRSGTEEVEMYMIELPENWISLIP